MEAAQEKQPPGRKRAGEDGRGEGADSSSAVGTSVLLVQASEEVSGVSLILLLGVGS